jgi:hypothetical protein
MIIDSIHMAWVHTFMESYFIGLHFMIYFVFVSWSLPDLPLWDSTDKNRKESLGLLENLHSSTKYSDLWKKIVSPLR